MRRARALASSTRFPARRVASGRGEPGMVVSQKVLSLAFGKSRSAPQCLQTPRLVVPPGAAMRQWWRHVSADGLVSLIAAAPLLV